MPRPSLPRVALACLVAIIGCRSRSAEPSHQQPPSDGTSSPQIDPAWTLQLTDEGRASVRHAGTEMVSFDYVFWDEDWAWAGAQVHQEMDAEGRSSFEIRIPDLGLRIDGKAEPTDRGELTFTYDIVAERTLDGIIGGGLDFTLRAEDRADPVLLGDQRGWRWPVEGEASVGVTFEPAAQAVFFERDRKDHIRAMLIGRHVDAGRRTVIMRLRLPTGGQVIRPLAQRYGEPDPRSWHSATLAWDLWPVDLSFLNAADRPAGSHGRVRAEEDALVFADGTPARFWGTNVVGYALFNGNKAAVKTQARRLAAFGFNLVRIHHHDSHWVKPNVFGRSKGTRELDDAALDRIDWWVKCLQDQGIYVWLDLHVQRPFAASDGIADFEEVARAPENGKGFNYVNPDIEARMREFAHGYLGRVNRYTSRRYVDDPGVVAVLVTNENDITHHFGNLFDASAGYPAHRKRFAALARPFIDAAGLEVPTLEPWKPGPNKIVLAELEARFGRRAIEDLRKLGYGGLVATTNFWGDDRLWALPALTVGDVVDAHAYGGPEHLSKDPGDVANFVARIASAQVAGKPLTITEWNVPAPIRDRFTAPVYLASIAALQQWDAPMLYAYLQNPVEPPSQPSQWSTLDDPGIMATMPAAALLYRRGDVRPAKKTYRLQLDAQAVYGADTSALSSAAIRTLYEHSKLEIGLPDLPALDWDGVPEPDETTEVVTDPGRSFLPEDATSVVSDTGELRRDFRKGIHTIDTPRSQVASGWIGGERIELGDVVVEVQTPKATVAVSSLDGQPIASSKRLLVTAVAQVAPSPGNRYPLLSQPVLGRITLRHPGRPMQLLPLLGGPHPTTPSPIPADVEADRQRFALPDRLPTHWFLIDPAEAH